MILTKISVFRLLVVVVITIFINFILAFICRRVGWGGGGGGGWGVVVVRGGWGAGGVGGGGDGVRGGGGEGQVW